MSTQPSPPPSPLREAVIAALWLNLVMQLASVSMLAVPVMAPAIGRDLGISTALLGTFTAILWTASLATSTTAGHFIGRFGAIRVSQTVLLTAALALAVAATGNVWALALAAVLLGLANGAETPASSSVLARLAPREHQPFIFSLKQTGVQIGGVIAGFMFPALLPLLGWRGALWVAAGLAIAAALALEQPRRQVARNRPVPTRTARLSFMEALRLTFRDRRLLRLAVMAFAYVAVQIALNAFLVAYLVADRGESLAVAGLLLAIAQAGGLVGRLAWGWVSGRLMGAMPLLAGIGVAMLACALLLGLYGDVMPMPVLVLLCFVFGFTGSGWNGVHLAEIARLVPSEDVARVTGATFLLGTCGLIFGPIAFAAVAAGGSFSDAYVMISAWAAVGVAALVARRPTKRA